MHGSLRSPPRRGLLSTLGVLCFSPLSRRRAWAGRMENRAITYRLMPPCGVATRVRVLTIRRLLHCSLCFAPCLTSKRRAGKKPRRGLATRACSFASSRDRKLRSLFRNNTPDPSSVSTRSKSYIRVPDPIYFSFLVGFYSMYQPTSLTEW
jgi:hypothetical protein